MRFANYAQTLSFWIVLLFIIIIIIFEMDFLYYFYFINNYMCIYIDLIIIEKNPGCQVLDENKFQIPDWGKKKY